MVSIAVKRAVRQVAGLWAANRWRSLNGPRLVVLTYHRVLPDDHVDRASEQPGMYVSPATLGMHLDVVQEHFELLHLDDWISARARRAPLPRLACAITFDDGWRDNYQYAYPLLERARIPATIFCVTDAFGGTYQFWTTQLARQLARSDRRIALEEWPKPLRDAIRSTGALQDRQQRITSSVIDRAIMVCKQFDDELMADFLETLPALPGDSSTPDLIGADEVREMVATGLIRVGSHTRHHRRLRGGTSTATLIEEIVGSADDLERVSGQRPNLFCYPNGDFTEEALSMVRRCYVGAAATSFGWNDLSADSHLIRRIGLHEDIAGTRGGFLARLASGLSAE